MECHYPGLSANTLDLINDNQIGNAKVVLAAPTQTHNISLQFCADRKIQESSNYIS